MILFFSFLFFSLFCSHLCILCVVFVFLCFFNIIFLLIKKKLAITKLSYVCAFTQPCTHACLCSYESIYNILIDWSSHFIITRNSDITNQSPEISPVVSVQVAIPGSLTTSPLHLYPLEAQAFAWRTRIMSVQGIFIYFLLFTTSLNIFVFNCWPYAISHTSHQQQQQQSLSPKILGRLWILNRFVRVGYVFFSSILFYLKSYSVISEIDLFYYFY